MYFRSANVFFFYLSLIANADIVIDLLHDIKKFLKKRGRHFFRPPRAAQTLVLPLMVCAFYIFKNIRIEALFGRLNLRDLFLKKAMIFFFYTT